MMIIAIPIIGTPLVEHGQLMWRKTAVMLIGLLTERGGPLVGACH